MQRLGWIPRLALIIAAGALLMTSVVIAVAPRLWAVANAHSEDPVTLPEFEPLAQRTYVYDSDGNEIALYELENSQPIDYEQIPEHVVRAFLTVEDKEFFNHDGVNVRSLFRATLSNFASDAPQQGASTITMQVVKNDFLAGLERDGRYKLLQTHYARMLEKKMAAEMGSREMGKQAIMERYLNTVFFGNNSYGIQAAAETYYGKTAAGLTFVEAAFLAGLVRSPSGFDPINEPERSRARWLQVLDRLVEEEAETEVPGQIITEEYGVELEESFDIPSRVKSIPTRSNERTYFTEALRDYLLDKTDILGETYSERYNQLFRGGLRIYTTLSSPMQQAAEIARRDQLPDTAGQFDAALVSLDVQSGAIRAMVGGSGFKPNENEVNMALSPRQTGSSIKFFILAAAVQAGAQAGDLIDGRRGCKLPNNNPDEPIFQINGGVSGFIGTLSQITASSINCGFARLSQIVGLFRVVDTTYRMAKSDYLYAGQPESDRLPIEPFASFATGANEMTALDMAAGIQTVANEGVHKEPFFVEYINSADGDRKYTHVDPGTPVLDRDAALETVAIMKGVVRGGTGRDAALEFDRPAFGKTGTQQDNTNAWFVGGTKQLATAVWVGDPDAYTPMVGIPEFQNVGVPKVQGGTFPADIWKAFMDPAHAGLAVEDWADPPPPERPNARLVLPGTECSVTVVGYEAVPVAVDPEAEADAEPTTTLEGAEPVAPVLVPITVKDDLGTTIPPDILDPNHPLPSVPAGQQVDPCF